MALSPEFGSCSGCRRRSNGRGDLNSWRVDPAVGDSLRDGSHGCPPDHSRQVYRGSECIGAYTVDGPLIVNAPMNGRIFETWIETQLAPTLAKGDVVILDNGAFHKSPRAEELVRAQGAWLLFLPPYSPDFNPIEMAFSKLKTLLRKRAARTFDAISNALGDICDLLSIAECRNFFKAAGYQAE